MQIDWSINLIGIINAVVFIGAGMYFLSGIRSDVNGLKEDFAEIKTDVKALTQKAGIVAVVETKIEDLKERFDDQRQAFVELKEWVGRELSRMWSTINTISAAGRTVMPL